MLTANSNRPASAAIELDVAAIWVDVCHVRLGSASATSATIGEIDDLAG